VRFDSGVIQMLLPSCPYTSHESKEAFPGQLRSGIFFFFKLVIFKITGYLTEFTYRFKRHCGDTAKKSCF
jgi:hypothetical protein